MENPFKYAPEILADLPPIDSTPPIFDPRKRLKALLSIPERDRTDEQWDEIVELEIQLAPGNRTGAPNPNNANHAAKPKNMRSPNNPQNSQNPHGLQNNAFQNPQNLPNKKRPRANNFRRVRSAKPNGAPSFWNKLFKNKVTFFYKQGLPLPWK